MSGISEFSDIDGSIVLTGEIGHFSLQITSNCKLSRPHFNQFPYSQCWRTLNPFSSSGSAFNLVKPFGAELWHHFKTFSIKASLGAQRCCSSPVCLGYRYCHFHLNLTWPAHYFSLPQQKHYNIHIFRNKFWSDQGLTCADPQEKTQMVKTSLGVLLLFVKFNPHLIFCLFQTPPIWLLFCPFHLQTWAHHWDIFFPTIKSWFSKLLCSSF